MAQAVEAEIGAAVGIIGPEPLHAVGDRISRGRCVISRCVIRSRSVVRLAVGDGAADDRAADNSGSNSGTDRASITPRARRSREACCRSDDQRGCSHNQNGFFHSKLPLGDAKGD